MSELHVMFRVADATYALPTSTVLQLESFSGATRVPGASDYVEGLIQVRGGVVPVVNLRVRFGLPRVDATLDSRVIVIDRGGRSVGLLADSAREIAPLDPGTFETPPEVVARQSRGFVKSVATVSDKLILIVDCDRVIGQEDLA